MRQGEGIQHLSDIETIHDRIREKSTLFLQPDAPCIELIGLSMKVLYDIATCSRGCTNDDHIFQYLAGRSYNLCSASFSLVRTGYYDEALNQVRSLGELSNLLSLFWTDPQLFKKWKSLPPQKRRTQFGPSKVRKWLGNRGGNLLMDDQTYGSLCEIATHVTPQTKPNLHHSGSRPIVGGIPQIRGAERVLEHLAQLSAAVAIGYSMHFSFPDLEEQIVNATQDVAGISVE